MNKKIIYSNQTGITLVVLVVTIIVLLILAGVTINALFGQSGIIQKARDAQNKMDEATQNDLDAINGVNEWIGKINGTTGGDDNSSTNDLPNVANETIPYYPDDTFTKEEETDLDNGLVIKDSNENEYVWIEVPKSLYDNEEYNTETSTGDQKPTSSTEYDKIEYCLHKYTDYYRRDNNGTLTSFTDTYYSDDTTGLTSEQYTDLKQKMLKSVYENGGFWVGRYEAGIETNRTSNTIDLATAPVPLSKPGTVDAPVYPYTYITCSQAQTLASKLSTGNYTSSLMFGVQWDLVMKHIEVKEVANGTAIDTIQSAIRNNSTSWGNYRNASFVINRGKYAKNGALSSAWNDYNTALAYCVTYEDGVSKKVSTSSSGNSILLTTGSSDACKKMNIYDLAGNTFEWTLEYTSLTGSAGSTIRSCVDRGGNCYVLGSAYQASNRSREFPNYSNYYVSFRTSIFK